MIYHLFIDESGPFDEAVTAERPSVVGGVCSTHSDEGWETWLTQAVYQFNGDNRLRFAYPDDIHCGPLLAGREHGKNVERWNDMPKELRRAFIESLFKIVNEKALFAFASRNEVKRFEFSPQATYIVNLVAALRSGFDRLAGVPDVDEVHITVAQRTIEETRKSEEGTAYTTSLLRWVSEQLLVGDGAGTKLARRLRDVKALSMEKGRGTDNPGLMAADVACWFIRQNTLMGTRPLITTPGELLFGDYTSFYERRISDLLAGHQYATAAEFLRRFYPKSDGSPDLAPLKHYLEKESDSGILERELPALLALSRWLIDRRTVEAHALASAKVILEVLTTVAEKRLKQSGDTRVQRVWADLLVDGLVDLGACHNHTGAVRPQKEIDVQLENVLKGHGALLSRSYSQRKELLLEARNRNLNLLFNDFRFQEVIDLFLPEVEAREKEIPPGETDELLGKMQGSIGQACSFLARTEPSWSPMARDYFEKSIRHFVPGTMFHAMSVNYLATLAWQEGNLQLACKEMGRHPRLRPVSSPEELLASLDVFVTQPNASPFDVVNYLRIAATVRGAGAPVLKPEALKRSVEWLQTRLVDEHPLEQVCKWLACICFQYGEVDLAVKLLEKSVAIGSKLSFTVQTIAVSAQYLLAADEAARGRTGEAALAQIEADRMLQELIGTSEPFGAYCEACGGIADLHKQVARGREGIVNIEVFLPFSYA